MERKSIITHKNIRDGSHFGVCSQTVVNVKSLRNAEGSAIVRMANTTVVCGIKAELAKPKAETPNEGFLVINVDLPPLCSPSCTPGPPSDEAQAITALVERALMSTQAVDLRTLCLIPERLAWVLYLDIICLNLDGGLLAAAVCAASAALKNTALPTVSFDEETGIKTVNIEVTTPLVMNTIPFATTFALFDGEMIQDPTAEEEELATGLVTAVVSLKSETAFPLYIPSSRPLSAEDIVKCMQAARQRTRHLAQLLQVATDSPER